MTGYTASGEKRQNAIDHKQVVVNDRAVTMLEIGNRENQTILFLHGYPENCREFEEVMIGLKDNYHLLAIDLPGIGKSDPLLSGDKYSIAEFLNDLIQSLNLGQIVLAGHDIGGMITYSFLRKFPNRLYKTVIMSTAIPGVEPWEEVKRNPFIWHFAFYSIPELPEKLIKGNERPLFDYFFNTLSANKNAIPEDKRKIYAEAYRDPESLKTSFEWYRAFPQDEDDNADNAPVDIPVLYLKGENDFGDIEKYIDGFRKSGLKNIHGNLISDCGHFAPEEQPEKVAVAISDFIKHCPGSRAPDNA